MKIGIVGQGFVGSAIYEGLKTFYDIRTYDLDENKRNCSSLYQLIKSSDIIFQCLPTPMKKSGECDIRIVESSLTDINSICLENFSNDKKRIVVIKSTVPPGTTKMLDKKFDNIDIIFSPEFLTEANSYEDFKNQTRIILGGTRPATTIVKTMFKKAFPEIPIVKTGSGTAEMVKYFTNCFLATKVSFSNEIYQICQANEIDYDKVTEYSLHDTRLGRSHFAVPGPDGDFGFGGHCFPKDLSAMVYIAEKSDIDSTILKSVQTKNDMIRKNRDWEAMKGRAVSED
jgi:nucleotide sugar dehydrogenase